MSQSPFVGACVSEWHKLRARPANLVMAFILVFSVILFAYILPYVQFRYPRFAYSTTPTLVASYFYPPAFLHTTIALAPTLSVLALIIGALAAGGEYSNGTLKALFTQGPSRLQVFFGSFVSLSFFLFFLTSLTFAIGALCSVAFAIFDNQSLLAWPAAPVIPAAFAATWLIFVVFAAFGVVLAHFFKQAAAAIGIGLAYLILIENLIVHYLLGINDGLDSFLKLLPSVNSQGLVAAFSPTPLASQALLNVVSAPAAVIMLLVYLALFLLVSATLLRRRDVF